MRWIVWLALLFLASAFLSPASSLAQVQQGCDFVLGFSTLHDLIPDRVGQCLENEWHNPQNGDALQRTTGGLMAWRKSDNWTAFTNGSQTWVNGPLGLQERSNDQRFWWEQNPENLAIVPAPVAGERCHTAGLSISRSGGGAAAGHAGAYLSFTNNLAVPCTFYGYPGAQMLDALGTPMRTQVVRGNGYMFKDPGPATITVPPGGTASFGLEWGQVTVGTETTCPESSTLLVTPPDEYVSLSIPMYIHACNFGTLHVTAVGPPYTGP